VGYQHPWDSVQHHRVGNNLIGGTIGLAITSLILELVPESQKARLGYQLAVTEEKLTLINVPTLSYCSISDAFSGTSN
jgi:hypothetical protein